jgi:glycosyltransferase involved in cell wall biosynthesis
LKNSHIRDELSLNKDPVLLCVGRLASDKFVDVVIKSMPPIIEEFPSSRLLIVGDGSQRNYLVYLSRKLMLDNSVIFCGLQPTDKIPEYFAAADIVICPYSGLVLFEAMACGKPIVAFDVEWHSEVIKNLENGILVENMSSNAISLAVIKLLRDPELRKNIGMHAHEFAIQFLDWEIIAIKYLNIFQEILKKDN